MLSIVLSATTIAMNRGEQETLFRQSANIRLQQQEAKTQHLTQQKHKKHRHYSYGNIHQITNLHSQAPNSRSFGEERIFSGAPCDDLVLSVLKTPLREQNRASFGGTVVSPQSCTYAALPGGSEDELLDDIESAQETTVLDGECGRSKVTSPLQFFRRFKPGRPNRFEVHHRRVPTPVRRKSRSRSKSHADILDGLRTEPPPDLSHTLSVDVDDGDDEPDEAEPCVAGEPGPTVGGAGVPDPYYPIALPIDQAFKAKYVFHHRRGKTIQERFYVFLEHPGGWVCFIYHFTV